jgi:hypothetical protein
MNTVQKIIFAAFKWYSFLRCLNTQYNILIIVTLSIKALNTGILSVIMLSGTNKSIRLSVVVLNVMAPDTQRNGIQNKDTRYPISLCWLSHFLIVMLKVNGRF